MKPDRHIPRFYQVAQCCGHRFSRWTRKHDRSFDHGTHTNCCHCGQPLQWTERRGTARDNSMRSLSLHTIAALPEPFTSRDTLQAFQLQHPDKPCSLTNLSCWLSHLAEIGHLEVTIQGGHNTPSYYRRTRKFQAPKQIPTPKNSEPVLPPVEQAWRAFRDTIAITEPSI
jgi:hypothetical protein